MWSFDFRECGVASDRDYSACVRKDRVVCGNLRGSCESVARLGGSIYSDSVSGASVEVIGRRVTQRFAHCVSPLAVGQTALARLWTSVGRR